MALLNCLPPRAAGVNYWFFLLAHLVVDFGIKQNSKCEMLLRKIDDEMNVHNCGFSAKLRKRRRWRHAPRHTATAFITDSPHRFSKRWHVADVKNIASDDQTTLMINQNFSNIACTFRFYVCSIATVVMRLTVASVATHLHRRISKRWHVADVKNFTGDDQANLTVYRNSAI